MSPPDPREKDSRPADRPNALSTAAARQIEVIVAAAEQAADDLIQEVEEAATQRATDILADAEQRADRIVEDASERAADYLSTSRRRIDDFAAERIQRLSELTDGLIEVAETIQDRHTQVEEISSRLYELITAVGSAAEAVAREAAQPDPGLPTPPEHEGDSSSPEGGEQEDESPPSDRPAGKESEPR